MNAGLRRRLRSLGIALLPALALSCLSPTLPLPPPEEPSSMAPGADGTWTIFGSCLEGAQVVAVNEATGRGAVFVDRDRGGRYSLTVEGEACDVVILSQSLGDEDSGETRIVLQATENGLPTDPSACSP